MLFRINNYECIKKLCIFCFNKKSVFEIYNERRNINAIFFFTNLREIL